MLLLIKSKDIFKSEHFLQDYISRTTSHGPNTLMDVLDGTKYQGPFDVYQVSQCIFWTEQYVH